MLSSFTSSVFARRTFVQSSRFFIRFTKSHEWFKQDAKDETVFAVGISNYARDNLGEVVWADSRLNEGDQVSVGETVFDLESIKAVAEVYSPLEGSIVSVNKEVTSGDHSAFNEDSSKNPLFTVKTPNSNLSDAKVFGEHMSSEDYDAYIKTLH